MQYRKLGTSGIDVSVVGIGCWAMGGPLTSWGPVDDNESIAAILQGIELGINLVDTAPSYGYGHSEEMVGKAVSACRERVVIATKCGLVWREVGGRLERSLRRESIRRECEASLRRLRVETIDVYQVHALDGRTPLADVMETLEALRNEGKVTAIGVSNFSCQQLGEARHAGRVDCAVAPLSLLEPEAAEDLLPYCREYGIGVIAHGTLARGLLTGKFDASTRVADVRSGDPHFAGDALQRNLRLVEQLRRLADREAMTVTQLAICWSTQQEGVTSALAGAKRPSQVQENAVAADVRISDDTLQQIDRLLKERE